MLRHARTFGNQFSDQRNLEQVGRNTFTYVEIADHVRECAQKAREILITEHLAGDLAASKLAMLCYYLDQGGYPGMDELGNIHPDRAEDHANEHIQHMLRKYKRPN